MSALGPFRAAASTGGWLPGWVADYPDGPDVPLPGAEPARTTTEWFTYRATDGATGYGTWVSGCPDAGGCVVVQLTSLDALDPAAATRLAAHVRAVPGRVDGSGAAVP